MATKVENTVQIPGAFDGYNGNMLNVQVSLTFDIPPALYSPGMTWVVAGELQRAIERMIEEARKAGPVIVGVVNPPHPEPVKKKKPPTTETIKGSKSE
jgi:hypothetical protein